MLSTTIASTNRSNKGEYAAISLLDKYARISSGLESTRKQTQKMRNEIVQKRIYKYMHACIACKTTDR